VKSTTFIPYLHANHIDKDDVVGYNIQYDAGDMEKLFDDNIMQRLTDSFCPSIKGWDRVKQVLILQHAGGTFKRTGMEKKQRAEIHISLIGDPGTAKSTLAEWSCGLVPGSEVVDLSGDNVTANGLTATAIKDDFGEGGWTIESGSVVKAHRKFLMMDECHLGKREIIGTMHRPMENQMFGVSKAGLSRTFRCEFSAIFVMNPKFGRFKEDDKFKPLVDLLDTKMFTAPWMDRIDYYAMLCDERDEKKDREMFRHITANKRNEIKPEICKQDMMQYFAYVRDRFDPVITKEIEKEIEDKFIEMRKNEGVYNRHQLSVFRFAEASAKIHCRNNVTSEDADLAIKLVRESLQVLTAGYGNATDMDAVLRGAGKGKRGTYAHIKSVIIKMSEDNDYTGAFESDLVEDLREGLDDPLDWLEELRNRGEVFRDNKNRWKVVQ